MAKDEDELISISVSHALMTVCDEICILIHDSRSSFTKEVSELLRLWPGKIKLFKLDIKQYYQESAVTALRYYAESDQFDWIYVFDADEFAITESANMFRRYLDLLPIEIDSVKYEVANWVSKRDFNSNDISDWLDMDRRSIASLKYPKNSELCRNEIFNGFFNFFDLEFPSKVIFRGKSRKSLVAGAHNLSPYNNESEHCIPAEIFSVAHFPLLTFDRLQLKRNQGQSLKSANFPYVHGWQSQMIDDLFEIGQEEDFWTSHSTGSYDHLSKRVGPTVIQDNSFQISIKPTVEFLFANAGVSKSKSDGKLEEISDSVLIYEGMRKTHWK